MCAPSVRLADATWRRMSYTASAMSKGYQDYVRSQGNTTLAWSHPAKSFKPARARELCSAEEHAFKSESLIEAQDYAAAAVEAERALDCLPLMARTALTRIAI